jgi:hypothetical protein
VEHRIAAAAWQLADATFRIGRLASVQLQEELIRSQQNSEKAQRPASAGRCSLGKTQ